MLKNFYAWIGHFAHSIVSPLLRPYFKRNTRVRVLVLDKDGHLLLMRSWFSHQQWSLPGGGIGIGEEPVMAAVREVHEETGLEIPKDQLQYIGEFRNIYPNEPFLIKCFMAQIESQPVHTPTLRRLEVLNAQWFPRTELPRNCSKTVQMALDLQR